MAANYRNRVTLEDAAELLRQIKCPIFNLPGNHELNDYVLYPDMDSEEAMTEIRRYQETMGPLYYSVNLGRAHLVVLNPCVRTAGESQMSYSVSKEQLAWLRKDLALVEDKTAPLLLAVHTPIYSYNDDTYGRFWLPNGAEVIECFREFSNIHILTGHTHRMYTSVLENGRITEHNYNTLGGTSGHWTTWRLPTLLAQRRQGINTDGSPASYGTLSFSGDRVVDYCVKGVNLPRTKRFRAYDRNAMRLSAAAYLSPELAQGPRGRRSTPRWAIMRFPVRRTKFWLRYGSIIPNGKSRSWKTAGCFPLPKKRIKIRSTCSVTKYLPMRLWTVRGIRLRSANSSLPKLPRRHHPLPFALPTASGG